MGVRKVTLPNILKSKLPEGFANEVGFWFDRVAVLGLLHFTPKKNMFNENYFHSFNY